MVWNRSIVFLVILRRLFRSDPDKDTQGWGENDRGVSFTFGADVVAKVRRKTKEMIKYNQLIVVLKSTWYGFNMSSTSSKVKIYLEIKF